MLRLLLKILLCAGFAASAITAVYGIGVNCYIHAIGGFVLSISFVAVAAICDDIFNNTFLDDVSG